MSDRSKVTTLRREVLRQAADTARPPVKVIAVTGGKGGVGKSVVCANLAVELAMMQRRPLLLDADLGLANANLLLGLKPQRGLRDVVLGSRTLDEVVVEGPAGLRLIPGASGCTAMSKLTAAQHAGIIGAFAELEQSIDSLLIDTAPGISDAVIQFAGAAQHVVVVVCNEPASIADAYAIIKVLHREKGCERFHVVTNLSRTDDDGRAFEKLSNVVERFLPVVLHHAASIPYDHRLARSVRRQTPVVTAYPRSHASLALRRLAQRVDAWAPPDSASGKLEFFAERLFADPAIGAAGIS